MKAYFCVAVLSLLVLSCHNEPTSVEYSQTISLAGNWLWTSASGGLTGSQVITPSNKIVLSFTSDGAYSLYRNDTLLNSSIYSVKKGKTIYSSDSMDVIIFRDTTIEKRVIFKLTIDSLELADNMYDGFGYSYIKIK
jgi:hypothetical protein